MLVNDIIAHLQVTQLKPGVIQPWICPWPWEACEERNRYLSTMLSQGISPKMNIIAQLEIKLSYFMATVQLISHYAMETSLTDLNVIITKVIKRKSNLEQ